MNVNTVTATTSVPATGAAAGAASVIDSDFQTFLVMLTTQMQNQDPLNPIDSSDYAVQLATFSGVEQQVKSNGLLENLVAQMGMLGMAQLAGWVGMEARAAIPAMFDGGAITLAPNPAKTADAAVLVVYDASGAEVSRQPVALSTDPIEWTGRKPDGTLLPDGVYSFKLEGYLNGNIIANQKVEIYAPIIEVRGENGGTVLIFAGGARVSANDVTALRQPRSTPPV